MPKPNAEPRACPVLGCDATCKHGHVMCLAHWRDVPRPLKRAVFDAFARLVGLSRFPGERSVGLRRREIVDANRQYQSAADAAIAAVEAKERGV